MTPEQKAYTATFYEGLIARLQLASTRALFGEDSQEFSMESARHEANVRLAAESVKELDVSVSRAGWQGWLDGAQRAAAIGTPTVPREFEPPPQPRATYTAEQLMFAELNGWMLEFYKDLPWCLNMIRMGARALDPKDEHYDVWSFFETLTLSPLNESSGNFGDGFTDEDRRIVSEYVNGDWMRAVELVERALRLPPELRPTDVG